VPQIRLHGAQIDATVDETVSRRVGTHKWGRLRRDRLQGRHDVTEIRVNNKQIEPTK